MRDTPQTIAEELCKRAGFSAEETEDIAERMYYACLQMCLDVLAPGDGPPPRDLLERACEAAGEWPEERA